MNRRESARMARRLCDDEEVGGRAAASLLLAGDAGEPVAETAAWALAALWIQRKWMDDAHNWTATRLAGLSPIHVTPHEICAAERALLVCLDWQPDTEPIREWKCWVDDVLRAAAADTRWAGAADTSWAGASVTAGKAGKRRRVPRLGSSLGSCSGSESESEREEERDPGVNGCGPGGGDETFRTEPELVSPAHVGRAHARRKNAGAATFVRHCK
jgi:hypothetical protein